MILSSVSSVLVGVLTFFIEMGADGPDQQQVESHKVKIRKNTNNILLSIYDHDRGRGLIMTDE
jgi:hypothetical protein